MQIYKVIISSLLVFSYFSTRARLAVKTILQFGYTVDYPIDGVKSRFSCSPLLYLEYRPISKFRDYNTKVLLRENNVSML